MDVTRAALDVLKAIGNARAIRQAMPDHPGAALPLKLREKYMSLLVMIALVDGERTPEEDEWLAASAVSLALDDHAVAQSNLDAHSPSAAMIANTVTELAGYDARYALLVDLLLLGLSDGELVQAEVDAAATMMELFAVDEDQASWLTSFAWAIASGNTALLSACRARRRSGPLTNHAFDAFAGQLTVDAPILDGRTVQAGEEFTLTGDRTLTRDLVVQAGGRLVIRNARVTLANEAMIAVQGSLHVENSEIIGSENARAGYLVFADGADEVCVVNSRLRGVARPGLFMNDVRDITIVGTSFEGCVNHGGGDAQRQGKNGGAIKIMDNAGALLADRHCFESVTIKNCTFTDCRAELGFGGAISLFSQTTKNDLIVDEFGFILPRFIPKVFPYIIRSCQFVRCYANDERGPVCCVLRLDGKQDSDVLLPLLLDDRTSFAECKPHKDAVRFMSTLPKKGLR